MKVYRGFNNDIGPISYADWIYVTPDLEQAKWYANRDGQIKNGSVIQYDIDDNLNFFSIDNVNDVMKKYDESYSIDDLLWYQEGLSDYLYKEGADGIKFIDPKYNEHIIYILFDENYLKNGKLLNKKPLKEAYIKGDKGNIYYTKNSDMFLSIIKNTFISKNIPVRVYYDTIKQMYVFGNAFDYIHADLATNMKYYSKVYGVDEMRANISYLKQNCALFQVLPDDDLKKYDMGDGYTHGWILPYEDMFFACRNNEYKKVRDEVPLFKNKVGFWQGTEYYEHQKSQQVVNESVEDNFNSKNNCKVVLKDGRTIYGRFIDKWVDNTGKGIFIKSNSANKIKENDIKELYIYYDCEVILKDGRTIYGNFVGDYGDHKLHLDDAYNRKGWAIKDELIDKVNYKRVLKKELNEGILGAITGGIIGKKYKHPYIGAYIGHKIQDKFFNSKNKKDNKENKIDYKKIIYNEIFNDLKNKKIGIDTAIDMLINNKIAKDYDDAIDIVDFWCYEYGLDKSLNESVENKILYIIRGVPGSGKSTLAHKLTDNVVEADQYFYDDKGNYNWSADKLNQAHNWCYNTVKKYMEEGRDKIAVANTFVKKRDYKRYVELAEQFGYKVDIRVCNGNFKNIHGVPDETVEKMRAKFQLDESVLNDKVFYTKRLSRMLNICLNIGNARFIYIPEANLYVMGDAHNNTHISLFISALNEGKFDIGENDVDEYFDEYINSAEDTGAIITKEYANDKNVWLKCPDTTNVINDYGKFYLCNGLCIEESLAKLTNTKPRFIKEKSYLEESIKSVNKNFADTKLITTPYELNNYLKNNRESRVVYDIKNNWYLVGNAETSIHINLINDAFVDGYYQPFEYNGKMINPDNELDAKGGKLIYELNPTNFILFRTSSDQLNGEDYYYDGYKYCYIYDDYYVFIRDNNFEKTSLYQMVLGFPKDIEFIGDIDEDEGLNESIVYASKKDLSDVILINPTKKELRDNNLVQCRCMEDSEGNWYFADMENMLHCYIVTALSDKAYFPLFDGYDCYGIAYYDSESNEFWYNLNDYMYRQECIEQYKNSEYLSTTFPNAKIIPNPWNNQGYDELYESVKYLNKEHCDTKIITSPYELRDYILNHKNIRIVYDNYNKWYFVNDVNKAVHAQILDDALSVGYYDDYDGISGQDMLCSFYSEQFPLFVVSDNYNENWSGDGYEYAYKYDSFVIYDRYGEFKETTLYQVLGNPLEKISMVDDEQLDESIAYVEKKDLSDVILENPSKRELREFGINEARCIEDDKGNWYFGNAENLTHYDMVSVLADEETHFKKFDLIDSYGISHYFLDQNLFLYNDNDYISKQDCFNQYNNSEYLKTTFPNAKIERNPLNPNDFKKYNQEKIIESAENDKTLRDYAAKLANICLDALVKTKYETKIAGSQIQINVDKAFKKAIPMLKKSPYEYFILLVSKKEDKNASYGKTVDKKYGLITLPIFSDDPIDQTLSILTKHKAVLNRIYSTYHGDELKWKLNEYAIKYLKKEIEKMLANLKSEYIDILIHECTHLIDDVRRTKTYKSKEQNLKDDNGIEKYYNSPEEQNAFYQETVSIFDNWAKDVGYKSFDIFFDDFIRQYKGEWNILNEKNKRKLKKRAYAYWKIYIKE